MRRCRSRDAGSIRQDQGAAMRDDREAGTAGGSQGLAPSAKPRRRYLGHLVWTGILLVIVGGIATTFLPQQTGDSTRPGNGPTAGGRTRGPEATPVGVATVTAADMPLYIDALGTVTPLATATIKARVSGQITALAFTEGQDVKAGDVIAEIDDRPYRYALEQVQGQLLKDQALQKNAEIDLARYQKLVAQDSLARQQLDTQAALVQQYQGVVKTDQANVENAQLNLDYTKVRSPIDGRLGLKQVDVGTYVTPSDSSGIVVVTRFRPISVIFSVPEDDISRIRPRVAEGQGGEVILFDRGRRKELARGKLVSIDNQIDTTTGTVKLRANFDNGDGALFPNQFVNVRLEVETLKGALQLPATAIQRGSQGTFVYRVEADKTVSVKPVKLGPASLDKVTVADGVAAGDVVVIDGTDKVRAGSLVSTEGLKQVSVPVEGPQRGQGRRNQQGGQQGGSPEGAPQGGRPGGPPSAGGPGGPPP
jgi:multidrug efflux system membrane fusion protein